MPAQGHGQNRFCRRYRFAEFGEIDARVETRTIEEMHDVFGCDISCGARGESPRNVGLWRMGPRISARSGEGLGPVVSEGVAAGGKASR
jgi:hypothetical protein